MMYDYNAPVPSRRVCHAVFTWEVRYLCYAEDLIKTDGIWSRDFPTNDESPLLWKIGIHEEEGKKLRLMLKYTFSGVHEWPAVSANVFLNAKIPYLGLEVSRFYSGFIKENIPLEFRLNKKFSDYIEHMEKKFNIVRDDFVWNFIFDIICYEDRYVLYHLSDTQLFGKKIPGRSTQIGIDLFKYACNEKFADMILKLDSGKIPAHKAIFKARCGVDVSGISKLNLTSLTNSYTVLYYFLLYLYCGNLECLMDVGVLPNGLVEFAEKMGVEDLAKITNRFQFFDITVFNFSPIFLIIPLPVSMFRDEEENISRGQRVRYSYHKWRINVWIHSSPGPRHENEFIDITLELAEVGEKQLNILLHAYLFDESGLVYERGVFRRLSAECRSVRIEKFVSKEFVARRLRNSRSYESVRFEIFVQPGSNVLFLKEIKRKPPQPYREDPYIEPCLDQVPGNSSRSSEPSTHGNENPQSSSGSTRHRIEIIRSIPEKNYLNITKLSRDFEKMLNQMEFSDVEFCYGSGSDTCKAHKVMLAARSEYFHNLLDKLHGVVDNPTMEVKLPITEENMKELMLEIYGANARTPQETSRLIEMYCMATAHGLSHFLDCCRNELMKKMTVSNCIHILKMACDHKDKILKEFIGQTFHSRTSEIYKTTDWLWISSNDEKMAKEFRALLEKYP